MSKAYTLGGTFKENEMKEFKITSKKGFHIVAESKIGTEEILSHALTIRGDDIEIRAKTGGSQMFLTSKDLSKSVWWVLFCFSFWGTIGYAVWWLIQIGEGK
jgi:hypothetical protein